MHGGRSTGPRTAEGMARLRAARTTHGQFGADARAFNRYTITFLRRGHVLHKAMRCVARLPADLAARLLQPPPELMSPSFPSAGLTPAQDRAVLRAEAEALAPWKQAIALARQSGGHVKAEPLPADGGACHAQARAHAPGTAAPAASGAAAEGGSRDCSAAAKPHAPEPAASAVSRAPAEGVSGGCSAAARAHAPETMAPAASGAPAEGCSGDGSTAAEPHAPETAAVAASGVSAEDGTGDYGAAAKAHAPERAPDGTAPALTRSASPSGEVPDNIDPGSVMITQPGVVHYPASVATDDDMLEAAIEAGADNVERDAGTYKITCAPEDFVPMRDALAARFGLPRNAQLEHGPSPSVTLDQERAAMRPSS